MVSAVKPSGNTAGIVMRTRRGVTGPVVQCLACRGRITDATAGVVLWQNGQDASPVFAHVGWCCRRVEASDPAALWMSQPLAAWLVYLANSTKLRWLKAGRQAADLASIVG
jgi:hypothetical protein